VKHRKNNLKKFIADAGLNNPSLAKLIGCKPVEIWRLAAWPEKGGRKMTPEWAAKIAPHINVKPHELIFGQELKNNTLEITALKEENEKLKRIIKELLS
jgi:hypothetical protein